MKKEEIIKSISEYLLVHNEMRLATISDDGKPVAHTVEFVADGTVIYFSTNKKSRKAVNISENSSVAYTVDKSYKDWMKIKGIQMEASAEILSDKAEIEKVFSLFIKKFPFLADFPANPDSILIKVEPIKGYFLDYTKGFAHKDEVVF